MYRFIVKVMEKNYTNTTEFVTSSFQLFEWRLEASEAKKALEYYYGDNPNFTVFMDELYGSAVQKQKG